MKSMYYILVPSNKKITTVDNRKFKFFDVVDDNGEIVDRYDYINIESGLQIDIMEYHGKYYTRVFRNWGYVEYDNMSHTIRIGGD